MASSELAKRVAVAVVGIPVVLALLYMGGWVLAAGLAALAVAGALEFYRLAAAPTRALPLVGAAAAAALVLAAAPDRSFESAAPASLAILVVALLLACSVAIWRRTLAERPLLGVGATLAGALYAGGTLAFAVLLRHFPLPAGTAAAGTALVLFPLAITWINDSAAYFVGRRFGRRKLIPRVSPGKTVEGALGGVVAGTLTGLLYATQVLPPLAGVEIGALAGALGGAFVSVVAQVGDLAESLFKREAGVKDSGALLPGHGGILDRFDALYFALPVAYFYLRLVLWLGAR